MNLIKNPIFIVGCDHSGTSLLISILAAHSKLYAVNNESYMFWERTPNYKEDCCKKFMKLARGEGKNRWVEKTPVHADFIPQILEFYPEGKIIGIIRDVRDNVCSLKRRNTLPIQFKLAIKTWNSRNLKIIEQSDISERVTYIKYEDLVKDAEKTLKKITKFIGEDWEDELLNYHKTPKYWYSDKIEEVEYSLKDHHQYRNWQINQPIFDDHIGRWKKELNDGEINGIMTESEELMIKLGYYIDK